MSIDVRPARLGSDGRCDFETGPDAYCLAPAAHVKLTGTRPHSWASFAPPAALAFLCDEHVDAEPLAEREHAEHNAAQVPDDYGCEVWAALLQAYPEPLPIAA
ncbi:hypothetical protein ACIBI9_04105 [Nonomuraea sp. NPDC050451]|uniref:hypothetical protein n=1 Tax=Nonomuraea sp. NPDC050451 TaxID=3364364 RepID=UPI00378FB21B